MTIRVGADPEVFMTKAEQIVSAVGKIGGSKYEPLQVDNYGHALQEDNVAIEYNIPPATTREKFIESNTYMINLIKNKLKEKENDADISIVDSFFFPVEQLRNKQARTFGCEPDYNVWLGGSVTPPVNRRGITNLRTCGGHIHISWPDPDRDTQMRVVQWMDLLFSVPISTIEPAGNRRALYGKAGCYRPKKYGVEYRTPSNFWLTDPDLMGFAFDCAVKAVENTLSNIYFSATGKNIQKAVDQGDTPMAYLLIKANGLDYFGV